MKSIARKKNQQPRNHVALALMNRGSATKRHGKSGKALRRQDKIDLRRGKHPNA